MSARNYWMGTMLVTGMAIGSLLKPAAEYFNFKDTRDEVLLRDAKPVIGPVAKAVERGILEDELVIYPDTVGFTIPADKLKYE